MSYDIVGLYAYNTSTAANASSYNLGFLDMVPDLHTTQFKATIGLSMYTFGFAITPLVTASFSEEFGRHPLYIVSCLGFAMMHLVVALLVPLSSPSMACFLPKMRFLHSAKNIHTIQIARFFQGAFGSTGSTMVSRSRCSRRSCSYVIGRRNHRRSLSTTRVRYIRAVWETGVALTHEQAWITHGCLLCCCNRHDGHGCCCSWLGRSQPPSRVALDTMDSPHVRRSRSMSHFC